MLSVLEDIAAQMPPRVGHTAQATSASEPPTGLGSESLPDALASASPAGPSPERHRFDPGVVRIPSLTGDGVVSIDRGGCIILANRAAEDLFGYSYDELVGCSVDILIPERFRDASRADVAGVGAPSATANRAMAAGREVSVGIATVANSPSRRHCRATFSAARRRSRR